MAKKKARKKTAKKTARTTKKAAKKKSAAKKSAAKKGGAKKVAKKATKKSTKKTARTTAKKAARKTTRKAPRPRSVRPAPPPPPPETFVPPMSTEPPPPMAEPEPLDVDIDDGDNGDLDDLGGVEEAQDEEEDASESVAVGKRAPDFTLPDETGQPHTLSAYRGKRVVLYFYPKDDTPGCTAEACSFRDRLGEFSDRDTVVLGVSPDSVRSHQRFVTKYGLTFPVLADENHAVADKYGVWQEKQRAGRSYLGIARTTFVINPDGRIARIFENVKVPGHVDQVLAAV